MGKNTKVGVDNDKLFDKNGIYSSIASDANGNPMFYTIPTRNYMVTLSTDM